MHRKGSQHSLGIDASFGFLRTKTSPVHKYETDSDYNTADNTHDDGLLFS